MFVIYSDNKMKSVKKKLFFFLQIFYFVISTCKMTVEEHTQRITYSEPTITTTKKQFNYQKRVSFDNVTNIPPAYHSFTLKQSTEGFERTRRSRTFMIAIDLFQGTLDSLSFTLKVCVCSCNAIQIEC